MSKVTMEKVHRAPVGAYFHDAVGEKFDRREDGWYWTNRLGESFLWTASMDFVQNLSTPLHYPDSPSILTEAQDTISTSRQADYGDASKSFSRIAALWSTYLEKEVSAQDVACLMALMKISRIKGDPTKRDSWVDLAGYAGLGGELG